VFIVDRADHTKELIVTDRVYHHAAYPEDKDPDKCPGAVDLRDLIGRQAPGMDAGGPAERRQKAGDARSRRRSDARSATSGSNLPL
jgi:hypothetical protein